MANQKLTVERVKNVMRDIDGENYKNEKMRRTLKGTFAGMKTLVNQMRFKNNYREAVVKQKRGKTMKIVVISVSAAVALFILIVLALWMFKI